jgi:hypothetical protein
MERKTNPLWSNAMNFGLIGGLAMSVYRLFTSIVGATFDGISLLRWPILILIIIYGTRHLRDKKFGGYIKYGAALGSGFLISLFSGIIFGFYVLLEFGYFFPRLLGEYLILQEEAIMKLTFFSDEMVEEMVNEIHNNSTPMRIGFSEILGTAIWGGLFALLISIFLKKENNLPGNGHLPEQTNNLK